MTDLKPDPALYALFAEDREQAPFRKPKPRWTGPTGRPAGRPRRADLVYVGTEHGGCKHCGVKLRGREDSFDEYPGTVVVGGYGLCKSCNEMRRLKEKKR